MSYHDHLYQSLKRFEVCAIAGKERKSLRSRSCRDEEVDRSCSSSLAPSGGDSRIDATIGAGCLGIESKRLEHCLGALEPVLATSPLVGVISCMGAGSQLGHGQ